MNRRQALLLLGSSALTACASAAPLPQIGADGLPLPQVYRISGADGRRLPFRVLDSVNALRQGSGFAPLELDARLSAAAETHSRDMSLQNRPWHFGSDGSSPIERAQRAGFDGRLLGETISETFETELQTVAAWLQEPGPRRVLLEPEGRRMGFGYFQERSGKIWYTLKVGT